VLFAPLGDVNDATLKSRDPERHFAAVHESAPGNSTVSLWSRKDFWAYFCRDDSAARTGKDDPVRTKLLATTRY